MSKLTDFQEKLITDLRKEFDKLNAKNEVSSSSKKFSLATVQNCIDEEGNFKEVIRKHNIKMIEAFKKMVLKEIKDFGKEFGKVIDIKFEHSRARRTFESFFENSLKNPLDCSKSNEVSVYFVSKVKTTSYSEDRWNYFNSAKYFERYLDFKCENVSVDLDSGKKVSLPKITGIQYLTSNWLYRENGRSYSSLDEMLQMDKETQRSVVELVQ